MFYEGFQSASDAALIEAVADLARQEARAAAERVAAIGELVRRRCGDDEYACWACDDWDAAAAELGAAMGISRGRASGEMHLVFRFGIACREWPPCSWRGSSVTGCARRSSTAPT